MEIDPLTVVAVLGMASLLVERIFYYRSKYNNKKREIIPLNPGKPENFSHGERLMALETDMENIKEDIREIKGKLP